MTMRALLTLALMFPALAYGQTPQQAPLSIDHYDDAIRMLNRSASAVRLERDQLAAEVARLKAELAKREKPKE